MYCIVGIRGLNNLFYHNRMDICITKICEYREEECLITSYERKSFCESRARTNE